MANQISKLLKYNRLEIFQFKTFPTFSPQKSIKINFEG